MAAKRTESLSAFGDRAASPTDIELRRSLGTAATAWSDLIRHVRGTYGSVVEEWSFASAKFGWSLRLKQADRVLLYLIPQSGQFLAGIVLGGKAVKAAKDANLPSAVLQAIAIAPRYVEGTGVRLRVSRKSELSPIEKLLSLKVAG